MKSLSLVLWIAAIIAVASSLRVGPDVTVHNLKLFYGKDEFFIKAMCYNPAPLGQQDMNPDNTGGTGLCSVKLTPFGDWLSACYDSDYFDGSSMSPNRWPLGPGGYNGQWFKAIWERDFPEMKALGVNTLRIYNTNPITKKATTSQPDKYVGPYGKDHIPFLDLALQYGFKVVFPLIGDKTQLLNKDRTEMEQLIKNQIDEVGYHPAIIMYTFGNELGLAAADPSFIEMMNHYFDYIRTYQQQKWKRSVPVTSAEVDLPSAYDRLAADLDVDIFTTNAGYRGLTFSDLWTGDQTPGFSGWTKLSCKYNKPVFIGEIGQHSTDGNVDNDAWFSNVWGALLGHINEGCIGGAFFEWNDEPMKADNQQHMGIVSFELNSWTEDGKTVTSRTENGWKPDTLVKKKTPGAYNWDAINNTDGKYNVSFHTDPFQYIGRQPYTLPAIGDCLCSEDRVSGISQEEKDKVCAVPSTSEMPSEGHDITVSGEDPFGTEIAGADTIQMSCLVVACAFLIHKFLL